MPTIEENLGWIDEAEKLMAQAEEDLPALEGYVQLMKFIRKQKEIIETCTKDIELRFTEGHKPVSHAGHVVHWKEGRSRQYGVRGPEEVRQALTEHGLDGYTHELIVSETREKLVPIGQAEKLLPGELHEKLAEALQIKKPVSMEIEAEV